MRQLEELQQQVSTEITAKRAEAVRWLKEIRDRQIVERGAPYRNPENPSETWSGKGPQPGWVRDALARGLSVEDLVSSEPLPAER